MSERLSLQNQILLAGHAGGAGDRLPAAAPLSLLELPLVLATYKIDKRHWTAGRLAPEFCRTQHLLRGANGHWYAADVRGSDELGLPYGKDREVWLSTLSILLEQARRGGAWEAPSLRQIGERLEQSGGYTFQRIRDTLARFHHLRVRLVLLGADLDPAQTLAQLHAHGVRAVDLPDDASVVLPAPGGRRSGRPPAPELHGVAVHGERYFSVLSGFGWEETRHRRAEGERWLTHVHLDPVWLNQAVQGWIGWIDLPRYLGLRTGLAQRLYELCAVEAAKDARVPFTFDQQWLRSAAAVLPRVPDADFKLDARAAIAELVEAQIVERPTVEKLGPRRYAYHLWPGPALRLAACLRGVTLLDPQDTVVALLVAQSFGVRQETARAWLATEPNQAYHALLYAIFDRETNQGEIHHAPSWLASAIAKRWSFAGRPAFEAWRRRREAAVLAQAPVRVLALPSAGGAGATPPADAPPAALTAPPADAPPRLRLERCVVPDATPEAVALWAAVCAAPPDGIKTLLRGVLPHFGAVRVNGEALVVLGHGDLYLQAATHPQSQAAFATALTTATDGRVTRLEVWPWRAAPPGAQLVRDDGPGEGGA